MESLFLMDADFAHEHRTYRQEHFARAATLRGRRFLAALCGPRALGQEQLGR